MDQEWEATSSVSALPLTAKDFTQFFDQVEKGHPFNFSVVIVL